MNILYISSFVYKKNSSAAIRNNKLIEGLVSLGCKVSVLTINYSDEWTDKALLENHRRLNISIFSSDILSASDITSNSSKQTIKKFLPKEVYKLMKNLVAFPDVDKDWLKEIFNIEDKYELVISSSDTKTSHFVAEKIFNEHKLKSKWVQIWGDPWATDVNLDFFTRKCVSLSESRLLKKASKIFYVSELTSLEYKDKYPEISDKIHHVGRSFYKKIAVNKSNTQKDSITIFYPGALNDNRVITDLCESIKLFNISNEIKVNIKICGHQNENVVRLYSSYGFIKFLGVKNIDEVYSEFLNSDFLLFVDNGKSSTQIPGKIFDYYGSNLPIIALISAGNEKMKDFLEKDQRSVILTRGNIHDISFVRNMKTLDNVNEYYSPESVARRFLDEV